MRKTGTEDESLIQTDNIKLLDFNKDANENIRNIHINEYTKYDPTLPHMTNIKCPNHNANPIQMKM